MQSKISPYLNIYKDIIAMQSKISPYLSIYKDIISMQSKISPYLNIYKDIIPMQSKISISKHIKELTIFKYREYKRQLQLIPTLQLDGVNL